MTLEQIKKEIESSSLKFGDQDTTKTGALFETCVACEHMKILRASPESELSWLARYLREDGGMADLRSCSACARSYKLDPLVLLWRIPIQILTSEDMKTEIKQAAAKGKTPNALSERGRRFIEEVLESN